MLQLWAALLEALASTTGERGNEIVTVVVLSCQLVGPLLESFTTL